MTADVRYPIGRFQWAGASTPGERERLTDDLATAPSRLRAAVQGLSAAQMDTAYRAGGWTVRQVVHHVADSHLNSYTRFRLALTEDEPTIKPYDEARWAELVDARTASVDVSLNLLDALHERWVLLIRSLAPADFTRTFRHPEMGVVSLDRTLALYVWHGAHHIAHITTLRTRQGW